MSDAESVASDATPAATPAAENVESPPKQEATEMTTITIDASPAPSADSDAKEEKKKKKGGLKDVKDLNGDKVKYEGSVSYRELYRYADWGDFFLLFFAILGSIAHGVSQPLFSVIFGDVINSFGAPTNMSSVVTDAAKWFVVLGAATAVVSYFQQMGFLLSSHRQVNQIRKHYFRALTRQDMAWYDAQEVGALTARIGSDMIIIKEGLADKVGTLVQMGAMFIGGFAVAFAYSWKMTLVILATVPLLAIAGGVVSYIMAAVTTQSLSSYAAANAVAEEAFTAMRTVVAFGGEERIQDRFNKEVKAALQNGLRKGKVGGLGMAIFFFVMFGSYGLAFWYGSTLINSGELDAGTVTVVFFSVLIGSMAIGQGAPFLQQIASARGAAYAIFKVIDRVPEIDSSDERGRKLDTVRGHIEFRNVKFTYPTRPEAPILRGLNLEIQPGQTVALVGASGCGKSTSVGLIERFYDPAEGEVLVDGVNVKELSLPWWRAQIGLVSQEPVLFARSIKENIRYGNLNVTDEEIIEAAKRANAHDFIMRLPKQYDTMVGERGGQLSGGQKQRVAIARALVRDPKVLLLDEATSALDNKSEKVVQDALDKASVGRTTIIIAHRLSTIRHADRIFVFDQGVIVEQGTHDELMALGGHYKDLVERQQVSDKSNKDMAAEAAAAAAGEDGVKKSKSKKGKKKDKEGDGTGTLKKKKSKKTKAAEGDATPSEGASSSPASPDLEDIDAPLEEPMAVTEATKTDDKDSKQKKEWKMSNGQMLKRTFMYNKPEWFLMFLGTLAACAAGAVFPLYAIIMSEMLMDLLFKRGDPLAEAAEFWALMFLALAGGTAISNYLLSAFFSIAGEHLTNRLREMLFKAYLRQDIGWFDLPEHATGVLGSKLSTDATLVQSIINTRVSILVQTVATLGAGIIIALTACWELALVVLACVPLVAVGGSIQMKAAMSFNEKSKKAYEQSSNIASECISNIRTVVSLGRMQEFYNQYHAALQVPNSSARVNAHLGGLGMGFSEFVTMAVMGLAFWYGGRLADPAITPGTTYTFANVMKAIMAIVFGAMMTGQLSTFAPDYSKARDAAESIYEAVDRVPPIDSYNTSGEVLDKLVGNIALRDVHFRYPSRPEMPVLRGLSLDIEPGKTTALVGSSGCGKSTIIQLLERFYDPLEGSVTIDGQDVRSLSLRWWRSQVGLVQQEPMLFACSIGENIRFGKPDATQAEIEAAAKLANAHNFITALPDGYNTMVGERGAQLSGGQKQRIAIARALVRNPKLLLLDEATSALDSESEQVVQEALDVARQGRTTIMIAHRLATVKNADVIVVIDQGVVIEKGTHDELLDKRGFYYSLVQSQNR